MLALWGRYHPTEISAFDLAATRVIYRADWRSFYVTVEVNPDHLRLHKLYLAPTAQGRGRPSAAASVGPDPEHPRAGLLPARKAACFGNHG